MGFLTHMRLVWILFSIEFQTLGKGKAECHSSSMDASCTSFPLSHSFSQNLFWELQRAYLRRLPQITHYRSSSTTLHRLGAQVSTTRQNVPPGDLTCMLSITKSLGRSLGEDSTDKKVMVLKLWVRKWDQKPVLRTSPSVVSTLTRGNEKKTLSCIVLFMV